MRRLLLCCLCAYSALSLIGCAGESDKPTIYAAEIRRTSFGVPHVLAKDEAGLGYGLAYAYAQDNVCMFAEMMVTLNGERSRYFGPEAIGGPDVITGSVSSRNLDSDFFFKYLNSSQQVEKAWREQQPTTQALLKGYAAGFNRYLADTRSDQLPVECRNAEWLRNITLYALPLDPADPTKYVVDGKTYSLTRYPVSVTVKEADGRLTQRSHDFWMSQYGPLLVMAGKLDWNSRSPRPRSKPTPTTRRCPSRSDPVRGTTSGHQAVGL